MKSKRKPKRCQVPEYISVEGHNLRVAHSKKAARILATDGKHHKAKRVASGCIDGLAGVPGAIKVRTVQTKNGIKTTWAIPRNELNKLQRRNAKPVRKGSNLSGPTKSSGTFRVSEDFKRKLSPEFQRGILKRQRRLGKRIVY